MNAATTTTELPNWYLRQKAQIAAKRQRTEERRRRNLARLQKKHAEREAKARVKKAAIGKARRVISGPLISGDVTSEGSPADRMIARCLKEEARAKQRYLLSAIGEDELKETIRDIERRIDYWVDAGRIMAITDDAARRTELTARYKGKKRQRLHRDRLNSRPDFHWEGAGCKVGPGPPHNPSYRGNTLASYRPMSLNY